MLLPIKAQSITQSQIHSHDVLSDSHFYGWVNQSPHDSIAAPGASNLQIFCNESYALTNCAITDHKATISQPSAINITTPEAESCIILIQAGVPRFTAAYMRDLTLNIINNLNGKGQVHL